ncbi:MAG: 3-oxoacyl-ACP reductase [Blastopirellula sp.]|nr:MAG: 3-oxoacyl-ACP reductase [Blastopirellula sp.]
MQPDSSVQPESLVDLTGKVAVVTGSSSGIGRAIALRLAQSGASVIVHANKNKAGAEETASLIADMGSESEIQICDFQDSDKRSNFVDNCWAWKNHVDIWINNAGADVLTGEAKDWSYEQKLEHLWNIDVKSTIQLSRAIGTKMREAQVPGGVILNTGWDQAEQGMEGESGEIFSTIKGAIMSFTRSLARSLAPDVRVNCLAPGWIQTSWGQTSSDYWNQRAINESLLKRWGTAEDVANMACFLASPAASFITGQIIPINGGLNHSHAE